MNLIQSEVKPLIWQENKLFVLDQKLIPYEKKYIELKSYKEVINAIKDMTVRGAPLIGITAGYGMALAAIEFQNLETEKLRNKLIVIGEEIKKSRPTAINLNWAVDLILKDIADVEACHSMPLQEIIAKRAIWIHEDDKERCRKIGEYGADTIKNYSSVLTICNTGALATGGIGTAFGVILTAYKSNPKLKIFAAETRPRQQGSRLTTFEFVENRIDCTLISDTACGFLMKQGEIDVVITGADRIAANGDTANKIGTYQLAVLAKENNIHFYIAAPLSTFDLSIKHGDEILIEERDEKEVTEINGKQICASGIKVRNPAFDITPANYIKGIITEKGVLKAHISDISKAFNMVQIA